MDEIFSRFKAKLKEIYYETPLPNFVKKFDDEKPAFDEKEQKLCKYCYPNNDPKDFELPHDFRDIKLKKTNRVYHLKLKNIPPHQWMLVGTKLRNMAFEDPEYGHEVDGDPDVVEPLPPPPEPTEHIKNMKEPLISLHLKNISWVQLEEVGEFFYDLGWICRKKYDLDDYEGLPDEFHGDDPDDFPTSDEEDLEEAIFDPEKRLNEEMTEVMRITNSDVIDGIEKVPWKDDAESWLENPHPDTEPWDDSPPDDFPQQGTVYPLQSFQTHTHIGA